MSSRVLRKLHGDKDLTEEVSDNEPEVNSTGARKKQLNLNRYDLLNQQSHSESEVKEDDNETEANKSCEGAGPGGAGGIPAEHNHDQSVKRKKRKKKKKSGKSVNNQRSSEDNADIDEVERSIREVDKILGACSRAVVAQDAGTHKNLPHDRQHAAHTKPILAVYAKHLNANNELKRIFGSKIVQSEHKTKKNRASYMKHHSHHHHHHHHGGGGGGVSAGSSGGGPGGNIMVSGNANWPTTNSGGGGGLSMAPDLRATTEFSSTTSSTTSAYRPHDVQFFAYEHSTSYRTAQRRFLMCVETLNPDNIVALIRDHPYHVDALIQLSDMCRLSEDLATAAELVERALYYLESAFHPMFSITSSGLCRLDYRRQENRALFITIFKHLLNVGGRACYRTALEYIKVLLNLDEDRDPLAAKLALDFYALRSREYQWLVDFVTEWDTSQRNLRQLPNFAWSVPLAMRQLALLEGNGHGDSENAQQLCDSTDAADAQLQRALMLFPGVLYPLLEQCGVQTDARVAKHSFFNNPKQSESLRVLTNLYVMRTYHVWKDAAVLPWLERNVHVVLDRIDANSMEVRAEVAENEQCRARWFQGTLPRAIARHIVLSDIKGVNVPAAHISEDFAGGVLAFDPFPPKDSINIYTKPTRPAMSDGNANRLAFFFRSLLPNFNPALAEDEENIWMEVDAVGRYELQQNAREDIAVALAPFDDAAAGETGELRRSIASLVGAMRHLLNNMRPDVPNEADVDENDDDSESAPDGGGSDHDIEVLESGHGASGRPRGNGGGAT